MVVLEEQVEVVVEEEEEVKVEVEGKRDQKSHVTGWPRPHPMLKVHSAVRHGGRHPAIFLMGLHKALKGGLGLFAAKGLLGLARFPADPPLQRGRERERHRLNDADDGTRQVWLL